MVFAGFKRSPLTSSRSPGIKDDDDSAVLPSGVTFSTASSVEVTGMSVSLAMALRQKKKHEKKTPSTHICNHRKLNLRNIIIKSTNTLEQFTFTLTMSDGMTVSFFANPVMRRFEDIAGIAQYSKQESEVIADFCVGKTETRIRRILEMEANFGFDVLGCLYHRINVTLRTNGGGSIYKKSVKEESIVTSHSLLSLAFSLNGLPFFTNPFR